MARIFLGLTSLSVALLAANLILAFAMGDFGARSRRHSQQRQRLEALELATDATPAALAEQVARLEQTGADLAEHRNRFWPHVWLGIIASLVSLLVNSISITYFIGTSRWTREVTDAYGMTVEFVDRSAKLKRTAFGWSFVGILLTLVIAGLGAAADPFSSSRDASSWVIWHWAVAMGGVIAITASFYYQYIALSANHDLIDAVMEEAARIRESRNAG